LAFLLLQLYDFLCALFFGLSGNHLTGLKNSVVYISPSVRKATLELSYPPFGEGVKGQKMGFLRRLAGMLVGHLWAF
jgi:hypothetical protein